jgi:hypothetical protein
MLLLTEGSPMRSHLAVALAFAMDGKASFQIITPATA